jgi:hypothetical protein
LFQESSTIPLSQPHFSGVIVYDNWIVPIVAVIQEVFVAAILTVDLLKIGEAIGQS